MLIVGALLMAAAGLVFASTANFWVLAGRRHHRRDQPERPRGGTVPVDRAGGALAGGDRSDAGRRCLPGTRCGLAGDGARRARRAERITRLLQDAAMTPCQQLPRGGDLLCRARRRAGRACSRGCRRRRRRPGSTASASGTSTVASAVGAAPSRATVVLKLSALFALDSFGGGFVVQSFAAYWFYLRFGVDPGTLGAIFFWAQHARGDLGAAGVAAGGAHSAWSGPWSSPTCRRTSC